MRSAVRKKVVFPASQQSPERNEILDITFDSQSTPSAKLSREEAYRALERELELELQAEMQTVQSTTSSTPLKALPPHIKSQDSPPMSPASVVSNLDIETPDVKELNDVPLSLPLPNGTPTIASPENESISAHVSDRHLEQLCTEQQSTIASLQLELQHLRGYYKQELETNAHTQSATRAELERLTQQLQETTVLLEEERELSKQREEERAAAEQREMLVTEKWQQAMQRVEALRKQLESRTAEQRTPAEEKHTMPVTVCKSLLLDLKQRYRTEVSILLNRLHASDTHAADLHSLLATVQDDLINAQMQLIQLGQISVLPPLAQSKFTATLSPPTSPARRDNTL